MGEVGRDPDEKKKEVVNPLIAQSYPVLEVDRRSALPTSALATGSGSPASPQKHER